MPVVIESVTYYAFGAIPLEAAGSDIRQLNTAVEIKAVGGAAIVLRSPATGAVIPSTLTSSAANGLLPSFLAPALQVVVDGGVVEQVLTSDDVPGLVQDVEDSRLAAEQSAANAGESAATVSTVSTTVAGFDGRLTLVEQRDTSGTGGYTPPVGGIPVSDLAEPPTYEEVVQNADGTWTPKQSVRPRLFVLRIPGSVRPTNALINGGTLKGPGTTNAVPDAVLLVAAPA